MFFCSLLLDPVNASSQLVALILEASLSPPPRLCLRLGSASPKLLMISASLLLPSSLAAMTPSSMQHLAQPVVSDSLLLLLVALGAEAADDVLLVDVLHVDTLRSLIADSTDFPGVQERPIAELGGLPQ